jgi:hypothetical protein
MFKRIERDRVYVLSTSNHKVGECRFMFGEMFFVKSDMDLFRRNIRWERVNND